MRLKVSWLILTVLALGGCDRNARDHVRRAQAHLAAGRAGPAAAAARSALERSPRRALAAEAAALLGRAEAADGHRSRALQAFEQSQAFAPGCCGARVQHAELLAARALDFVTLGRLADARRDLDALTRLAPDRRDDVARVRAAVAAAERAAAARPPRPGARADCATLLDPTAPECQALERAAPVAFARLALAHDWAITYPKAVALLLTGDAFVPGELDALLDVRPLLERPADLPPLVEAAARRIAGDEPAARRALERALAEQGTDPRVRRRIAVETLLWGDLVAADRHLRWAAALAGDPGFALEERALLLRLAGDWRGEWQLWLEAARAQPEPAPALQALGARYLARAEPVLAAAAYALAVGPAPGTGQPASRPAASAPPAAVPASAQDPAMAAALVEWWRAAQRPPAAARAQALATWQQILDPAETAALQRRLEPAVTPADRARARLAAGDAKGTLAALQGAPDGGGPACPAAGAGLEEPAPLLRVRALAALGERDAAVRLAVEWADAPAARACRYPLAMAVLEEVGELDAAVRLGRALKAEAPEEPSALLRLGRLEALIGDTPGAALDLEGYLYGSLDRPAAFDTVARALLAAGRSREACGAIGRALAFRGGAERGSLLALGRCLVVDGQAEQAAAVLELLLRATPAWGQPRARREAAAALAAGGALERARPLADPVTLAALGDGAAVAAARARLEELARRRPLDPGLFVRRAEVQAAAGDLATARALLERARAIRPASPEVQVATARLAARLQGAAAGTALLRLAHAAAPEVRCEADAALAALQIRAADGPARLAARRRLAACTDSTLLLRVPPPATASAPRTPAR